MFNILFTLRAKARQKHQTIALLALCEENAPVTDVFPLWKASKAKNDQVVIMMHLCLSVMRLSQSVLHQIILSFITSEIPIKNKRYIYTYVCVLNYTEFYDSNKLPEGWPRSLKLIIHRVVYNLIDSVKCTFYVVITFPEIILVVRISIFLLQMLITIPLLSLYEIPPLLRYAGAYLSISISELGRQWFRLGLVTYSMPSRCLNQWWSVTHLASRIERQWNYDNNGTMFHICHKDNLRYRPKNSRLN